MSRIRRQDAPSKSGAGRLPIALVLLAIATFPFIASAPARGNMGYELAPNPVFAGGIEFPHGVAVDQASRRVYVAVVSVDPRHLTAGEIRRFESDGTPAGTFNVGAEAYFSGVAVNPVTQGFYGAQARLVTPFGDLGTPRMDPFSSTGTLGTPFSLSATETLPQIAADSAGNVYFPNAATHTVQVFDSSGALQEEIACGGCPGGAFGKPVSVAVDSEDDLYVADLAPDRVVKLTLSGGSYGFDSVLQSGRGAAALGVDPSTDDVFVGDTVDGSHYHVIAYDSSGSQFDDFGAGELSFLPLGPPAAGQIAADGTTHRLYMGEVGKVYVFERVTIPPPSATANTPSPVGQIAATLRATVNARKHAVLECEFEYTDEADFQANGFANAASSACPTNPDGSADTTLSVELPGLPPETAYRYRVTATSNGGTTVSGSQTFTTLPVVPATVTAEPPLAVTQTTATLEGKVNPRGGSASDCHFELGTSLSYGTDLPCPSLPAPVSTTIKESQSVSGLEPSTTYHYRLVVSTNAGTTAGDDVEFQTAAPPVPPIPGPVPTPAADPPAANPPAPGGPVAAPPPLRCKKGFRKKRVRGKVRCVKRKRAVRHSRNRPGRR